MASALLHMSCSTLKNDIIGMESSSLNDALRELDRGKRDHDVDDLDRCQVKKRRKQSKPSRITSTESIIEGDIKSTVWVALQQQSATLIKEAESLTSKDDSLYETCKENKKTEQKIISDAEENIEENCSGIYNTNLKKDFSFPLNLSHKTPSPQESVDSFSSTIDERGWYKHQENATLPFAIPQNPDPINLKTQPFQTNIFQSSQACNVMLPNFKRILVGNSETQIGSPHRIFNPEAFCDLCNKEFCNKYFLKTHKANKHGIYMENIGPAPMENLPTLPIMNYFSSSIANLTLSNTQLNKKISNPNFSSNSNKSSSSMRAFCNICQREFCNKYFVRRHKAKIHGIVENNIELDYKQVSQDKPEIEGNFPGPSTMKLNKDFNDKDLININTDEEKTSVKKEDESEENDSPHDALSLLVSSWQNEDTKECSKSPDRNKKGPNSSSSAFCDICCKEYCNKYFLRVHKQKCHGVPLPEKDDKTKDITNNLSAKANQSMPLNLILRESNKNTNEMENVSLCNVCNIQFPDKYSLKTHQDQLHREQTNEKQIPSNSNKMYPPQENPVHKQNIEFNNQRIAETSNNNLSHQENMVSHKKNPSPDIQKMNAMLLKLNQHIPFENFVCDICNLDFGSVASLENHIIRDHAGLIEEISNSFYEENQNFQSSQLNKLECIKCQKLFPNISLLEHHLSEKHSISESKSNIKLANESQEFSSQMSVQSERQVMHTPTSSFCEICKKELCNKYFMKTHMQRMHGISIENGAHIGGVVCDICNKELCSKYFLRVHKQNSHGIIEEAFLPQISSEIKVPISNADNALRPNDNELNNRYFSHFTEVCSICNRRFRSAKWLRAHLLNDHGDEGKDKWKEVQQQNGSKLERSITDPNKKIEPYFNQSYKSYGHDLSTNDGGPSTSDPSSELLPTFLNRASSKQYQCTYCPFSSTVLALLLVHERTHVPSVPDLQELRCPFCSTICENNESLEKHLALKHNSSPFSFKKACDGVNQFNDNSQIFQFDDIENKRIQTAKDNNYEETSDSKAATVPTDACFKCNQCSFVTSHIEMYSEHLKNDHKTEEPPQLDYLQIIRDALLQIANNSHIPASFAVPSNIGNFMMQPFVLEDKPYGSNSPSTFLSSLVFLPVKERLNKPITASFKLTPT